MKTMFDTARCIIAICSSPEADPPLYMLIDPATFWRFGAMYCAEKKMQPDLLLVSEFGVMDVSDYIVEINPDPERRWAYEAMKKADVFDFDTSIDVSGYSLNKLQGVIISIVTELAKEVAKATPVIH